jgi:CcmD family protein
VTNLSFLFAAYSAVWLVLFVYLLSLSRRHRGLERQVEDLRRMLEKKGE